MIQFLKSSDGRHGSMRHADPVDQSAVWLESTEPDDGSAEHSVLTEAEVAEIRRAFQQQPTPTIDLSEVNKMHHAVAQPPTGDRVDHPENFTNSQINAAESAQMSIDVLTGPTGTGIIPHPDTVPQLAIEHILIEGLVINDAANDDDATAPSHQVLEAGDQTIAADAALPPSYEAHQTGPLTYFQYYLNDEANGPGGAAAKPADYVSPVRHTAIPSGLIGASVLGVTLVSGFVIADTLKTQSFTGAKRSTQPSPRLPLAPKTQATGGLTPQIIPPEAMPPEVDLPKAQPPQVSIATNPVFPPLPPLAKPRPAAPISIAMAAPPTINAVLPQRSAVDEITAPKVQAPQPTLTVREVAAPLTVSEETSPLTGTMRPVSSNPPQVLPQGNELSAPSIAELSAPPIAASEIPVPQPSPAALTSPIQPTNRQPLAPATPADIATPAAKANSAIAQPLSIQSEPPSSLTPVKSMQFPAAENTGTTSQRAPEPDSTSTFDSAAANLQVAAPTTVADRASTPPTKAAISSARPAAPVGAASESQSSFERLATIVRQPRSSVSSEDSAPAADSRAAHQFTSAFPEAPEITAVAPTTITTTPVVKPSADSSAVSSQMQQLLTTPEYRGYLSPSNQWRSLTRREAAVAVRAEQLGAFTRQELNQQDYIRAYRLVSKQVDALPPFGFIDYQRKLILLPPESATALLNETYPDQSQSGRNQSSQNQLSRNRSVNHNGAIAS